MFEIIAAGVAGYFVGVWLAKTICPKFFAWWFN